MSRPSIGLFWGGALVCLLMSGLEAQPFGSGANVEARRLRNPVQPTPQSIASGKELYSKNCRSCHGPDGKGQGTMRPRDIQPSDLTDAAWSRGESDGEIFTVLRDGVGPRFVMRGYKARMTDQELWHLVNYIRTLGQKAAH